MQDEEFEPAETIEEFRTAGRKQGFRSVETSVCKKGKEQVITSVEIDLIFTRLTGLKKQISKTRKITASIEFRQFL